MEVFSKGEHHIKNDIKGYGTHIAWINQRIVVVPIADKPTSKDMLSCKYKDQPYSC